MLVIVWYCCLPLVYAVTDGEQASDASDIMPQWHLSDHNSNYVRSTGCSISGDSSGCGGGDGVVTESAC